MTGTNFYCAGEGCRRTTRRLTVRMQNRTYYYCVNCGRRLELRGEVAEPPSQVRQVRQAG